jgi:hypothetical protein
VRGQPLPVALAAQPLNGLARLTDATFSFPLSDIGLQGKRILGLRAPLLREGLAPWIGDEFRGGVLCTRLALAMGGAAGRATATKAPEVDFRLP